MFEKNINTKSNHDEVERENSYECLASSSERLTIFNEKTSNILSEMMRENKSIIEHANNIIKMNDELMEENKKLVSENVELKEILKKVSNMIYVTCPECTIDKDIIFGETDNGESIMYKLITKGECTTTCIMCGARYKVYNGRYKIETSKL